MLAMNDNPVCQMHRVAFIAGKPRSYQDEIAVQNLIYPLPGHGRQGPQPSANKLSTSPPTANVGNSAFSQWIHWQNLKKIRDLSRKAFSSRL
ncbi:hypothetical protein HUS95_12375 [Pseudomonas chlororaphis]|uniref:hypothetical protein n=1 Tax=Pseudomonas chlororaphis TaxID=587753 RepID=UPI001B327595|nr:hypothetical protein [Pseudomonas chlororaphis]MBP5056021.1 hypothetical protein [Pseudomonas chlororaphis]